MSLSTTIRCCDIKLTRMLSITTSIMVITSIPGVCLHPSCYDGLAVYPGLVIVTHLNSLTNCALLRLYTEAAIRQHLSPDSHGKLYTLSWLPEQDWGHAGN
jgi:hypothetical protein